MLALISNLRYMLLGKSNIGRHGRDVKFCCLATLDMPHNLNETSTGNVELSTNISFWLINLVTVFLFSFRQLTPPLTIHIRPPFQQADHLLHRGYGLLCGRSGDN